MFPDQEHAAVSSFLRELAASDCSPATARSYAYALLRWLRFLHERLVGWERAERSDVRAFVEYLRAAPKPQRRSRVGTAPPAETVNPRTVKPTPGEQYAARTINHELSALFGFYQHACDADLGPLINPVPAQRGCDGGRVFAHHNPMEDFVWHRRATYRQKTPRSTWRAIPDDAEQLFGALRCHRDRAMISFWLSTGVRAAELLRLRHSDLDVGHRTITWSARAAGSGRRCRPAWTRSQEVHVPDGRRAEWPAHMLAAPLVALVRAARAVLERTPPRAVVPAAAQLREKESRMSASTSPP